MNTSIPPSYAVAIEPENRLMRVVVRGFWSVAMLPDYVAELLRQVAALKAGGGCDRVLVDMSDFPIQSRDIADAHCRYILHSRTETGASTAIITNGVFSRLQAKRMAHVAGHELFEEEASARSWLLSQPVRG